MNENTAKPLSLPDSLRTKLVGYQRRIWQIKLAEGILAALFGLLVSYQLVLLLDRFFDTPALVRGAILLLGALGLGLWFPLVCHRWIWKSRKLEQVARMLKRRYPRFGDRLLGVIELVNNQHLATGSETLTRAAIEQVDVETLTKDFSDAVPNPKHLSWAWAAAVPAVIAILALLFIPAAGSNAFARWLMPWKDIDRYTFAKIENLPEQITVPIAEEQPLNVVLANDSQWKPTSGRLSVKNADISAGLSGGRYEFSLPPLNSETTAHIKVGDVRESVGIVPKARPELENISAHISLPDYLQREDPVVRDVRGGSVSVVQGGQVRFEAGASRELASATLDGQPIRVDGRQLYTSTVSLNESRKLDFSWTDSLGLNSKSPLQLRVRVEPDAEPTLVCDQIERRKVLLEKDVLSFNVNARDDFGVKQIGIEWVGQNSAENSQPVRGEKTIAAGNPQATNMDVAATFSPQRDGVAPQALVLRAFVEDYLPGRKRIYSPAFTVFVVSDDEHFAWLTQQLNGFYKDSLEIYERESALHQKNNYFHGLSAEELNKPGMRRKLLAQASAEAAQARNLKRLTKSGEKLVEEATRNDLFMVGDLERLAQTIASLKKISNSEMPSVASLLEKAGSAPPAGEVEGESTAGISAGEGHRPEPARGSAKVKSGDPTVGLDESSMDQRKGDGAGGSEAKPKSPALDLPSNLLKAVPNKSGACPPQANQPQQQAVEEAVEKQSDLLAEFQKISEDLAKLMATLEGTTFVKRLKSMARKHTKLAKDINLTLVNSFGDAPAESAQQRAELLARRETGFLERLKYIREDMDAFVNRVQPPGYEDVLKEMKESAIEEEFEAVSAQLSLQPGISIVKSEFIADTLDNWAEKLVPRGGT